MLACLQCIVAFKDFRIFSSSYIATIKINYLSHYFTGKFTCPVAGFYYFSYTIYIKDAERFDLELVRDGTPFAAAYGEDDNQDQGSISIIIPCNAGDQVKVCYS